MASVTALAPALVASGLAHQCEYADIAARIASDLPRLRSLRQRLRPAMAASPLCDAEVFADALMQRLSHVRHEWWTA